MESTANRRAPMRPGQWLLRLGGPRERPGIPARFGPSFPFGNLVVAVGLLGGFTIFSTFSCETLALLREGAFGLGPAAGGLLVRS